MLASVSRMDGVVAAGGGGGRGRGRLDPERQRAENEAAPRIPHLGRRIAGLFRPWRGQVALIVVLVLVSSALTVVPPLLTQRAFDEGLFPKAGHPNLGALGIIVGAMVAVFLVTGLVSVAQTYYTSRVGNAVMGGLRTRMFEHLQRMDLAFFTRTKTGEIQSRIANDVGGVSGVLTSTVTNIIGNVVTVASALVAMLLLSWQLTLVAVVVMPFLVLIQRRLGVKRQIIAGKNQEALAAMSAITQESLSVSGILLSRSFNRERTENERYAAKNREQIALQIKLLMSGQYFFMFVTLFLSSIPAIIYLLAGWLIVGGDTSISAGTIVAFTTVQARLLFPLVSLLRVSLDLQTSAALFARIFEYLDLKPAIEDAPGAVDVDPAHVGEVRFDAVDFAYPGAQRDTLHDVSFDVAPGQFVAFVGPSGAGKTTISYLVPRLYDVTGGAVLFAGTDVRKLRQHSLIDHIGIVSQETYLFHASIEDNIRYAKPDATDAEIERAARGANIHDRIMSFPEGYRTLVGERGYRLSGGEKQRVAIARVLLKNPAVLVLDEATSALDSVSESIVQSALDDAARGRTTIAIAHRLSTVRFADLICVVKDGRIVERGTHDELISLGGGYAALHAGQERAGQDSPDHGEPLRS